MAVENLPLQIDKAVIQEQQLPVQDNHGHGSSKREPEMEIDADQIEGLDCRTTSMSFLQLR